MSSKTTRSQIGSDDIKWYDGVTPTFTRLTSTGGSLTLNAIGGVVDVYEAYGSGTTATAAILSQAISAMGTTNKRGLLLRPGTWTIDADLTVPANFTLIPQPGAILTVSTGITLTINGAIEAGRYQIFDWAGTGTFAGSPKIDFAYPEWFGATGDGSTDDYADVEKAITVAQVWLKPVSFRQATYKLNTKLTAIDISKTKLIGEATTLDFTGITAAGTDSYAIQLHSAEEDATSYRNLVEAMKGFFVKGSTSSTELNHTGICIGHATNTRVSTFTLTNVYALGFKYNWRFIDNAWHITLRDCSTKWGGFYVGTGLTNFGSKMVLDKFGFYGTGTTHSSIGQGDWSLMACTFDGNFPTINGEVTMHIRDTHFEWSGSTSTSGYWLNITHAKALVVMTDCWVVPHAPASFTNALFKISDDNLVDDTDSYSYRGLHIRNLHISDTNSMTWYAPTDHRTLVEGIGTCTVKGVYSYIGASYCLPFALCQFANAIYNGGQEQGDLTGWTTSGTGAVTRDSGTKKNGSYSMKMTCTTGQNATAYQEFDCRAGESYTATMWVSRTAAAGSFNYQFIAYNLKGDDITDSAAQGFITSSSTTSGFIQFTIGGRAPKGTVKVRLNFYINATSGTCTQYIDDVIINVY